ncbi:hypothetical protein P4N68_01540 [Corynebacterium felinum]|uniref:Uncharacterized protein n=1 Tax=Corynebacterium felinum TaxID=131318 RepID=A0ABU2B7W3_9CORY|nr:hypothetical protein [Corynebacterium felinum]MDF5819763.1 hypothetical protein [Corynebacterium felinum]MDR7354371.1 hypothetical protein [Corynebacterium felinum]WJY93742.1 hypothetical protein CFELI_00425 [Corynebacterium felinum]
MLIPNYLAITTEQYNQIVTTDPDTAVGLVLEWLEESIGTKNLTDIDNAFIDLSDELTDPTMREAVGGNSLIAQDPPLFLASAEEVQSYSSALESYNTDNLECEDAFFTLADFYAHAATNNKAVAVLYN